MRGLKKACIIVWLEICQWKKDCRIWMVFLLEAAVVMRPLIGLSVYGIVNNTKTTPWVFTLLFADLTIARSLMKVLLYLGVIVLFCSVPSINLITPSILLRGKRRSWIWGEIGYVLAGAALYLAFLSVLSILCVLPSVSLSEIWGSSLYQIESGDGMERLLYIRTLLLPSKVLKKIYPEYALIYTLLTGWLSFSFLGLLIMAVNIATGKKEVGLVMACILVMIDPAVNWVASWGPAHSWLYLVSPVSWTSIEHLKMVLGSGELTFGYVAGMSLLFCSALILFILMKARRMEIETVHG